MLCPKVDRVINVLTKIITPSLILEVQVYIYWALVLVLTNLHMEIQIYLPIIPTQALLFISAYQNVSQTKSIKFNGSLK